MDWPSEPGHPVFMPRAQRLEAIDSERLALSAATTQEKKAQLGQFLTPSRIARFMAGLLPLDAPQVRLLDPGAGLGALSVAVLERRPDAHVTAYEIDDALLPRLKENLGADSSVEARDFIHDGVLRIKIGRVERFTHAILNPPYKKIATASPHRQLLQKVGLETVNLYSGFVGLALLMLDQGGYLCAIVPRSFCNGPYYKGFRQLIFRDAALLHMHLFESRDHAFSDDDVLQENMIVLLRKGEKQDSVRLTSSVDATFANLYSRDVSFDQIVRPQDVDLVIHFPARDSELPNTFSKRLSELGVEVSTGPVVDFRVKEHLRASASDDTVPLIYPAHFDGASVAWPREGIRKPNAIVRNEQTEKWLYPAGNYVVVRRFSSKEERRRIVASLVPANLSPHSAIGLENHLNVFHRGKRGLPMQLALGLMTYLNATPTDEHFRMFNGHTQVNASDLKMLTYPALSKLNALGAWATLNPSASQEEIDSIVVESA
ncbi:MAG: Eco57I restriction-modification methylase domain-containing protein [Caulobacteraceae bacterium]